MMILLLIKLYDTLLYLILQIESLSYPTVNTKIIYTFFWLFLEITDL